MGRWDGKGGRPERAASVVPIAPRTEFYRISSAGNSPSVGRRWQTEGVAGGSSLIGAGWRRYEAGMERLERDLSGASTTGLEGVRL